MQSDIQLLRELLRVAKKAYMFPNVEEIAAQLRHTIEKIEGSDDFLPKLHGERDRRRSHQHAAQHRRDTIEKIEGSDVARIRS